MVDRVEFMEAFSRRHAFSVPTLRLCRNYADLYVEEDEAANAVSYFDGSSRGHTIGKAGEWIFCRWLVDQGLWYTESPWCPVCDKPKENAPHHDYVVGGMRVEVKSSTAEAYEVKTRDVYGRYGLPAPRGQLRRGDVRPDIYVFVIVDRRVATFENYLEDDDYRDDVKPMWAFPVGWASYDEMKSATVRDEFPTAIGLKPIAELGKMETLVEKLKIEGKDVKECQRTQLPA